MSSRGVLALILLFFPLVEEITREGAAGSFVGVGGMFSLSSRRERGSSSISSLLCCKRKGIAGGGGEGASVLVVGDAGSWR